MQRHLALLRLAAAGPRLICLDEPSTGLNDKEAQRLLAHIRAESQRHAMLVVLHNQMHARLLGGTVALLAGGVIQEIAPLENFFSAPNSSAGQAFVHTGSCAVPSPGADPATLDPQAPPPAAIPPEAHSYVSDAFGPRGFLWLKKGRLAGTPRPGIVHDLDYDLKALGRVGVTTLISLTCTPPDSESYKASGIVNLWFPIPDMGAPPLAQAQEICRQMEQLLAQDAVIAVHCRAGLGRTGTLLAAYLIWEGQSALDALETVRRIEPRWVQSETQLRFLEEFAFALANGSARHAP
jgi:atypical dual specificity phosphatase